MREVGSSQLFRAPVSQVAHDLCDLVEADWNDRPVQQPHDRARLHLLAGYSAAFGHVEAALRDAEADDPDSTAGHVRTLVSIILKSLWLVASDAASERERRRRSQNRKFYDAALKQVDHLQRIGADDGSIDRAAIARSIAKNEAWFDAQSAASGQTVEVDRCDEATVADKLGLALVYALTYRHTSDAIHFGQGSLLNRIDLLDDGERVNIHLRPVDADDADQLLGQGLLIYAHFLDATRDELGHGITTERIAMTLFGQPTFPNTTADV